jgi:membrane protease YdiL (CAAX protease family)
LPRQRAYGSPVISEKRWDTLSVLMLGAMVFSSFVMALGFSILAQSVAKPRLEPHELTLLSVVISLLCIQGMAVLWVHIFLKQNSLTWGEAFGFAQNNYSRCIVIVLLALALTLFAMVVLATVSTTLLDALYGWLQWEWLRPQAQGIVELLKGEWPMWLIALQGFTAIVVAPVGEELLFRGVLYTFIKQRGHPRLALWSTGILFALVHGHLTGFLFFIFLSMVLVAVYERTRNLFAPILLHSLFNTVGFTMIVARPSWAEKLFDS